MRDHLPTVSFILLVSFFLSGCHEKKSTGIDAVSTEKVKIITLKNPGDDNSIGWNDIVQDATVIPLETSDNFLISTIDKMIVREKYIYILDQAQQKLFIFQLDGKYFGAIEKGEAPNTSKYINDFTFDKDGNILILSYLSLETFRPDGKKLKNEKLVLDTDSEITYINPFYIAFPGNSIWLWSGALGHNNVTLKKSPAFALTSLSSDDFELTAKYFPVHKHLVEIPRFSEHRDSLFFVTFMGSDTIYAANNRTVAAKYFIDFGRDAFSNFGDILDPYKAEGQIRYSILENTSLCGHVASPVVGDRQIVFRYVGPPHGQFHNAIYDRRSGHVRSGQYYDDKFPPFIAFSEFDDQIICSIQSEELTNYFETTGKQGRPSAISESAWKTLSEVKLGSNPTLLFIKFKPF